MKNTQNLGNYEAQAELLKTLNSNKELVELVSGGFHNKVARETASFPRLVYTEIKNIPTNYADNEEREATVNFQISIFTDSSTVHLETTINKIVDYEMNKLKYKKYDSQSLYEVDTKLHHKALRYTKKFIGRD